MEGLPTTDKAQVWQEGACMEGATWSPLSGSSRAWLYTADRLLLNEEQIALSSGIESFLAEWVAHGQSLQASWRLEGGRCLIIALDDRSPNATGCSIDAKVHWLQAFGEQWGVDWMNRNTVIYFNEEASAWSEVPLASFWAARKAGMVNDDTRLVNVVVSKKLECEPTLVCAFSVSWHQMMWG
jgi:hypothetical protein